MAHEQLIESSGFHSLNILPLSFRFLRLSLPVPAQNTVSSRLELLARALFSHSQPPTRPITDLPDLPQNDLEATGGQTAVDAEPLK